MASIPKISLAYGRCEPPSEDALELLQCTVCLQVHTKAKDDFTDLHQCDQLRESICKKTLAKIATSLKANDPATTEVPKLCQACSPAKLGLSSQAVS